MHQTFPSVHVHMCPKYVETYSTACWVHPWCWYISWQHVHISWSRLSSKGKFNIQFHNFCPNSTTNSKSASLLPTVCITPFQVDSFNFLNAFNFLRPYVVDSVAFRYYICNMKTCLRFSTNFVDVLSLWNFQLKSCRRAANTSVPLLLHKSVIQCYVRASFTIIVSVSSVACFTTIPSINNFIEHRSLIAACCFSWLSFSCDVGMFQLTLILTDAKFLFILFCAEPYVVSTL